MRLLNLSITGFSAFRDRVDLELSQLSCAAIVGANHSGKTSILQAIEYALYGPTKGSAASLVNRASRSMKVELTFSSGSSTYVVTRSHSAGGKTQKLTLACDGADVSSRDLATTTATLESAIGMSRTVALATWMSMQGEIDYLARLDGPRRRDVLMEAFDLGAYAPLAAAAKAMRKEASTRLAHNTGALESARTAVELDAQFDALSDDDLRDDLAAAEDKARRDGLESTIEHHETTLANLSSRAVDLDAARRELEANTRESATLDALADEAHARYDVEAAKVSEIDARVRSHRSARDTLAKRRATIERADAVCTTCGQDMSPDVRAFALAEMDAQIAAVDDAITSVSTILDAARDEADEAKDAVKIADGARDRARSEASSIRARIASGESERRMIDEHRAALDALYADLDACPDANPRFDVADVRRELTMRDVAASNAARAAVLEAEIEADTELVAQLGVLVAAYSPSGIPMATLRGVAAEISDDANDTLDLMGSDLRVALSAEDASVDITIIADGATCTWSRLSGQERFFVALALRRSLTRAVSRRSGMNVETLLIDEGWGSLDADHAQRAVEALVAITSDVAVLTVTHVSAVSDQMPQRIEVAAGVGTSSVAVLA